MNATPKALAAASDDFQRQIKPLITKYCVQCHGGKSNAGKITIKGKVNFVKVLSSGDVQGNFELFESAAELLKHKEMPPEKNAQPTDAERKTFAVWYQKRFVDSVKARPGVFKPRRLSAAEFENTLNSLFGFELKVNVIKAEQTRAETSLVMKVLPPDPPGKSGFKNDTHSAPLTTALWNKYSQLTEIGIGEMFSKRRRPLLEAITGPVGKDGLTLTQAEKLVRAFAPRAHRRPIAEGELAKVVTVLKSAKNATDLQALLHFELKAMLMSPRFLYRGLLMPAPAKPGQYAVDDYELAERLSYFMWSDMPDAELFALAAKGDLSKPKSIRAQVDRMLKSPKARALTDVFAVEWLGLEEIDRLYRNPPQLHAFKSQPRDFMNYLFTENRPVLELIDSKVAFVNQFTAGFYDGADRRTMKRFQKGKNIEVMAVPNQRITLEKTVGRGGIITIPGVLQMNKGPVIRGMWMLERILGEHLPDPPMNVGQVPKNKRGENLTFRQRFEMHRANPSCAVCHKKIDPLGFALQQYDGRGKLIKPRPVPKSAKGVPAKNDPYDASGQLPTGEKFDDFEGLKKILMTTQRRVVIGNVVKRMLAFALGRKLTIYDSPVVNRITDKLDKSNGTYGDLIFKIATSLPFTQTIIKEQAK